MPPTNAYVYQPVHEIPRVSLDRHQSGADALPVGEHRAQHTRAVVPGRVFTPAEIAEDYDAHLHPETRYEEQMSSAVVYAARNQPDRIPVGWLRRLVEDTRADTAERLNLLDVDCHRCHRAVLVPEHQPTCPCGAPHSTSEADLLRIALEVLRVKGMRR